MPNVQVRDLKDLHSAERVFWADRITIEFGGLVALDKVSLEVHRGQILGLIGPNGSGKTTFFNIVTGIYPAKKGDFFLEGEPLGGMYPHEIARRGVARTFQLNRICLDLSVADNVLVGMHRIQRSWWADAIVRRGRLAQEVSELGDKAIGLLSIFNPLLRDRMGEPANLLSQIDRRRLEICRAIALGPKLLLLDEPAAGMIPSEVTELMDDISKVTELYEGISIIIVEHDMGVISKVCNHVAVLNYGRKIAEGTFSEVARNGDVREAYLGTRLATDE